MRVSFKSSVISFYTNQCCEIHKLVLGRLLGCLTMHSILPILSGIMLVPI